MTIVHADKMWMNVNNKVYDMINGIQATEFFEDFLEYYGKAKQLQLRNEGYLNHDITVDDPLMMNVHIYDCVERRQAGFSNALEDIHGKRSPIYLARLPELKLDKKTMRLLHLIHRFTGSGASFEKDHGYRNSILPYIIENVIKEVPDDEMKLSHICDYFANFEGTMVTSIGNQPPSLKNEDPSKYRLAQQYYFANFAEKFINDYSDFLQESVAYTGGKPMPIKTMVDFCCAWHKNRGFKQWKFVITAFVMDDAEYYPEDVNPNSHCYFGANCIRAFKLMFTKPTKRMKKQDWHDACMDILVKYTGGQPYSLEDVACDMIRYWTEYIPKNGYSHLYPEQTRNNSTLKVGGKYPLAVKARFKKVIGYHKYGQST